MFRHLSGHAIVCGMSDPDLCWFHDTAITAISAFPEPFLVAAQHVLVRVSDWPPADVLKQMGIDDPLELTGLYDGVPLTCKSISDPAPLPDTVWLYREPILDEWRTRGDVSLTRLVSHVTVHEFAHHFGWSDADIATIDRWWE